MPHAHHGMRPIDRSTIAITANSAATIAMSRRKRRGSAGMAAIVRESRADGDQE
jgi:hypothetical protein